MTIRSGYTQTIQGLTIDKDVEAELIYTFDWVDWLPLGDSLTAVEYTASVRANDPYPLVIASQGFNGTNTFVELHEGQLGKTYSVTCKITTSDQLIDRRSFRVKVVNRSA